MYSAQQAHQHYYPTHMDPQHMHSHSHGHGGLATLREEIAGGGQSSSALDSGDDDENDNGNISVIKATTSSAVQAKGKKKEGAAPKKSNAKKAKTTSGAGAANASNADDEDEDKKKQRSSKACDACRRQKCKCTRILNEHGQEEGPCQNCKQTGIECTFLCTSKKRGPPKGYIEAIENRMHRMEALLGGLLNNDDPRAQALLEELVGDIEARELLSKDLAEAAAIGKDNAPLLKSWQRPTGAGAIKREESVMPSPLMGSNSDLGRAPITQRGFDMSNSANASSGGPAQHQPLASSSAFSTSLSNAGVSVENNLFNGEMHKAAWIPDDELLGGSDTSPSFSAIGHGQLDNAMDFDTIHPARSFDNKAGGAGGFGGAIGGAAGSLSTSFASSALNMPAAPPGMFSTSSTASGMAAGPSSMSNAQGMLSTSPRQRRKLDLQQQQQTYQQSSGGNMGQSHSGQGGSSANNKRSPSTDKRTSGSNTGTHNLFSRQNRAGGQVPAPDSILHTGSAYYNLTAGSPNETTAGGDDKSPSADGLSPSAALVNTVAAGSTGQSANGAQQDGPLSELADVVGQLSLDDTREVRYHGRSSGLYLISKSARYQDFFWRFSKPGNQQDAQSGDMQHGASTTSPNAMGDAAADLYAKTEAEIVNRTRAYEVMPDKRTSDHLLELYWTYVHPHLPLLYRSLFVRQYRNTVHTSEGYSTSAYRDTDSPSSGMSTNASSGTGQGSKPAPALASGGKVPAVLLLSIYALASRYSDTGEGTRKEGEYWKAGEAYALKARELLHEDFGSSRLTTCQALLLLAYREAGVGAMAKSWTFVGMAIRMAQDLGLFRDVDKWFLPVNAFGYEEKQTRKRVWWSCIILDRYISAYIGRPMAIFERDYDVALPAEDEPDEHDIWRPLRPDGTDWSDPPIMNTEDDPVLASVRNYPQGVKSNSLSCFNHSASLSVLFSRIIANLYAIRVRVLGQNSETLLAHLDQALATWWLKLPAHLQYNSASKRVPPPHVLTLHCQFYAALILLHRPFIPAQGSARTSQTFPSHSICTTAAAAISNIVTLYSKTYGLRQAVPFMVYYVFSAGIMHFYNSTYDESLALTAKAHCARCMSALKEMQVTWGAAKRQRDLLVGLVDFQDSEFSNILDGTNSVDGRGRKREAEHQDVESLPNSGRGTPAGNRMVLDFSSHPPKGPFATASIGAMGASTSQPTHGPPVARRTASQSKRRHNSISAASLRQNSQAAPSLQHPSHADSRIGNMSTTPTFPPPIFPTADFTFVSPPAPSAPLPSPGWGRVGGFEFPQQPTPVATASANEPSPSSFFNFASPPMIPPASEFSSHDNQHISNILGLTNPMDIINSTQNGMNAQAGNTGQQVGSFDFSTAGFTNPDMNFAQSTPAAANPSNFSDLTEFLFDPFWQSQMRHMAENGGASGNTPSNMGGNSINIPNEGFPQAGQTPSAGESSNMSANAMFGSGQHMDIFGSTMNTDYNTNDWHSYLTRTPDHS